MPVCTLYEYVNCNLVLFSVCKPIVVHVHVCSKAVPSEQNSGMNAEPHLSFSYIHVHSLAFTICV